MINSAFYEKVVELNPDAHRGLRLDAAKVNFGFARHCTLLPVVLEEISQAAREYPVVFIRGDDQQLHAALLLGVREAENLFVNFAGMWDAEYLPVVVQHYPFVMASYTPPFLTRVDEACSALNTETGELLIDTEGVAQQRLNDESQYLQDFQDDAVRTDLIVRQLDELGVIVAASFDTAGEVFGSNDLYLIDEDKLRQLDDARLPGLFRSGAMKLAYTQIASLENISRLLNRSRAIEESLDRNAAKKPLIADAVIPLKRDPGMQKPVLKARLHEESPALIPGQSDSQRKQDVLKKLTEEKNRLAQEHRQRYAKDNVEAPPPLPPVPPVGPPPGRSGAKAVPVWGGLAAVLLGVGVYWVWPEQNSVIPATPVAIEAATQPIHDADPFSSEMLRLAPGKFEMGSVNGDADEKPVQVSISREFEIGKTEVTQGQWRDVMGSLPDKLHFTRCGDDCPVENVSWNDAQEFIVRLNARTGKQYRLPSEAEWEYACRAGGTHAYCGSKNPDAVAWYGNEKIGKTPHPVAGREPNAWGLYDMSGNVWEWVGDCYRDRYSDAQKDTCDARVLRGGSWSNEADTPRAANRYKRLAKERFNNSGFRLARGLP